MHRIGIMLGQGLVTAGLKPGDRVGNLFHSGECYGSFMVHVLSVAAASLPAVQVPIGGSVPLSSMANLIEVCQVTVVLSTVTTLVRLAEHCTPKGIKFPLVHTLMFGGEPIFRDQQNALQDILPNAKFRSCIYAGIDYGVLGTSTGTDDVRLFKIVPEAVHVEICPDVSTGEATTENGVEGSLLVTNLNRRLLPIIRYPTGDKGEWVDHSKGIFRLLGRDQYSVRVGPVSYDFEQLQAIVPQALNGLRVKSLQAVIDRPNGKDMLLLRVDADPKDRKAAAKDITAALKEERPMLADEVRQGRIDDIQVRFMPIGQMDSNPVTGKTKGIVDLRDKSSPKFSERNEKDDKSQNGEGAKAETESSSDSITNEKMQQQSRPKNSVRASSWRIGSKRTPSYLRSLIDKYKEHMSSDDP